MHPNQIAKLRENAEAAIQLGGVSGVTVDQLTDHMVRVEEIAQQYGISLKWQQFPLTVSDADLVAAAEAKAKKNKRSAGARALSAKYGKEAAERIIERKTGRHISLQR